MERTPEAEKEYQDWMKSQSGYIGKSNKAAWWDNWEKNEQSKDVMGKYVNNPGGQFFTTGDGQTQQNIAANLSQVGAMTGQNIFQTGQQQQDYYNSLQSRRNGDDAVAANMTAGRNRNLANVGRQFAGKGVSGGVAAAGMNTATNTADSEINAQRQKNARTNDQDLWNYVKRNQKVTGEALAAGKDEGLAQGMDTSQAEGVFGTVICTELHRQGLMSDEMYKADQIAGRRIMAENPYAFMGYYVWARHVAALMKKSPLATKTIKPFALAWAKNVAGEYNLLGDLILQVGLRVCFVIGKVHHFIYSEKAVHV